MDLLRISTAGSVDDGKSTLIGRLLYDTNALTKEQEQLIEKKTAEKGLKDLDFSVITDGLIAEREQGITIDVAHIYFSTRSRKFIIADSPGHVEYTRNMVTGASNAEVSIILIDARKGLLEQSYRHYFISQLLRLGTVVFCINKMDLVDYSEDTFLQIAADVKKMVDSYEFSKPNIEIIPISSLKGDNVVNTSENTPWYQGATLNDILHSISPSNKGDRAFRMDVQQVLHVQNEEFTDFRGFSGRISSGNIKIGDTLTVLPSGKSSTVKEIRQYENVLEEAHAGDSVIISLNDEVDASRGSLLVKPEEQPEASKSLDATLVWLNEDAAHLGGRYIIQAGSRQNQVKLQQIHYLTPPENPELKLESSKLELNDIAKVELRLAQAVFLDNYRENKANGTFILIDPQTNNTCAVGFVGS
ncbi:sulfate adenylyltransferase [Leptobacterium flavescens]|uniref:sulfate adenylyltransferase n=1 Tax=Leptobacterium flavescens TaxID=472055 RepID=A0A6P0UPE0_9FLAO|nr:GTP-binding protein [Leptobacterium flavescens]NER15221.1 sulfate adenylyltransferase [Leptobacterium flavescens]